jgi:4'-phosphopantetheinyl transferase
MTSINFKEKQILCSGMEDLPESCNEGCILLITAGLGDLAGVELPATERERASKMEILTARRFLAARRVVRAMFSKLSGIPTEKINLDLDSNGKPFLDGMDYQFSMAHSGEMVAVAISRSPIGVDLEIEREVNVVALAQRFFSPEEALILGRNPDPTLFFSLWTCREAAIKADGRGLAKLLGQTKVDVEANTAGCVDVTIGEESWMACHCREPARVHVALAFREQPSLISWSDLRREVIL